MLRAHHCLLCGDPLPPGSRLDRKFCRASCRSLACRQRQRFGLPTTSGGGLPPTAPLEDQERRPPSLLVTLILDLEEKLTALSAQRDAASKRIAELEVAVALAAARQSEIAGQNQVLRQDLAAAQARIGESARRLNDRPCATPQPEDESTRRSRPVARRESQQGTTEHRTDDLLTQSLRQAVPSVQPFPSTVLPAEVISNQVEAGSTARPKLPPLDLTNATDRSRLATAVVRWVERQEGVLARAAGRAATVTSIDTYRVLFELISVAVVAEIVGGQGPAGTEQGLLPRALDRIRETRRRENPKSLFTLDKWAMRHWIMVTKVVEATVEALQHLREQVNPGG